MAAGTFLRRGLAALGLAVAAAAAASADGVFPDGLTAESRDRLDGFDEARAEAIELARTSDSIDDIDTLAQVLVGRPMALLPAAMEGVWRCRYLYLGGRPVLVVYGYQDCRIRDGEDGLRLEKQYSTDLTIGTFYDLGEIRLGYAGAWFTWNERDAAPAYGDDPARDQVGYLVPLSPDRMGLEMPYGGTRFHILELRRPDPCRW